MHRVDFRCAAATGVSEIAREYSMSVADWMALGEPERVHVIVSVPGSG